jgi:hypothetical protein
MFLYSGHHLLLCYTAHVHASSVILKKQKLRNKYDKILISKTSDGHLFATAIAHCKNWHR